ncbi:MAG: hypothetical protein QM522_09165 [Chitinophagaceae bacterium]|nr:hypothetical protein [Chitinophagaceae bacterium]
MTIHRSDYSSNQQQNQNQHAIHPGGFQADHCASPPFVTRVDASVDPVEAYFECITTCSLDDGECVTSCTEILRQQN